VDKKKLVIIGLGIVIVVAILSLWDFDGDGLVNIFDRHPTQYSFPATSYAKGLISSTEIVERLSCLDSDLTLDGNETVFIDYLSDFEEQQQNIIVQSFLADGVVSFEERCQILFLNSFAKADRVQMVENASFYNFNWDGDSWSNYFERFVSKTPYDVKNDIYAIIMTHAGQGYPLVKEMFDILEKAKVPKDHVYDFGLENNNSTNFKAASDEIARAADKNDTVIFILNGEGYYGGFAFHEIQEDGRALEYVPYTWFRDVTDKIPSQIKVWVLDTCLSGSAIKYLEGKNKIILTSATAEQTSDFGISLEFLKAFSNPLADIDKNGYVSIGEAAEYAKMKKTFESRQAQLSDISNIGKKSYLLEIKLE